MNRRTRVLPVSRSQESRSSTLVVIQKQTTGPSFAARLVCLSSSSEIPENADFGHWIMTTTGTGNRWGPPFYTSLAPQRMRSSTKKRCTRSETVWRHSIMRTFTSSDGLAIRVGENAVENQRLCKEAKQNDLWFHLEGQSSPHAILSVGSGKAGKSSGIRTSLHECQQLVKHFSSAR